MGRNVRVIDAWHRALYGPDGFYRTHAPSDHFTTSAQGIPGVGELLARMVAELAARHGLRHVVDVGCGRGELLARLHESDPALRLTGLDVVDRPSDLPDAIEWVRSPGGADLPDVRWENALVLAHEWLDVVPCEVLLRTGDGDRLAVVAEDGFAPGPHADERSLAWAAEHWPEGDVVEVGAARDDAHSRLRSLLRTGLLVAVDYGHLAASRPASPTLTGFRDGVETAPRFDGSCDVTAHVAVDSLGADRLVRQADLARELLAGPPATDHETARCDPLGHLAALRERGAWSVLTAPEGLGGFWWALTQVSPSPPGRTR